MLGARPTTYLNELRDRTMHLLAANMIARLNDWKIGNWLIGQGDVRVYYQWMRLEQLDQWHHWFLLLLCIAGIVAWVVHWYRKDWEELPRSLGVALLILRMTALIGLLIFFLDLQKRSEKKDVRSSKVAVLVDTSLSMTMPLEDNGNDPSGASSAGPSRIGVV